MKAVQVTVTDGTVEPQLFRSDLMPTDGNYIITATPLPPNMRLADENERKGPVPEEAKYLEFDGNWYRADNWTGAVIIPALPPWEVLPDGYRWATQADVGPIGPKEAGAMFCDSVEGWITSTMSSWDQFYTAGCNPNASESGHIAYAVPENFKQKPKMPKCWTCGGETVVKQLGIGYYVACKKSTLDHVSGANAATEAEAIAAYPVREAK